MENLATGVRGLAMGSGDCCLVATCGIQFPDQGSNPGSLHCECRVLATGQPGKSHNWTLIFFILQTGREGVDMIDTVHSVFAGLIIPAIH